MSGPRMSFLRRRAVFVAALWIGTVWMCAAAGVLQAASPQSPQERVRVTPDTTSDPNATVKQYCAGCHNERLKTDATATGVILDRADVAQAAEHPEMWEKVVRRLR